MFQKPSRSFGDSVPLLIVYAAPLTRIVAARDQVEPAHIADAADSVHLGVEVQLNSPSALRLSKHLTNSLNEVVGGCHEVLG